MFFGKETGWAIDTPLSNADASFFGENAQDHAGWSVNSAGDVNGDGFDDILIGATGITVSVGQVGHSYLVLGKASGWAPGTILSESDASYVGEGATDEFGSSVASAGDINGDGLDDILIGAPLCDENYNNAGKTYVVFGKTTGWAMNVPAASTDATFIGENQDDECGSAIGSAGDINGDGFDDILIGAPENDDIGDGSGKTYLFLGNDSGLAGKTTLLNVDVSFMGETTSDKLGCSVTAAGDVNSDGFDDFLIGAYGVQSSSGKTYLILGKDNGWVMDTSIADVTYASFSGESDYDSSGISVASGDVNNDGARDIIISADHSDGNGTNAGQVYLILNEFSPWDYDTNRDGIISKQEALVAVVDFFAGQITKQQALEVIVLFFS